MAIYCMSDIHGHFFEFQEMLDKIAFGPDDELYVLGDIIDRGSESAEMLIWAVDKAPANIHFMCGNHEDMALEVVEHNPLWLQMSRKKTLWNYNGGRATVAKLKKLTHGDWRAGVLLPWLRKLPVYAKVNASGEDYMLVHAGFNVAFFDNVAKTRKGAKPARMNVRGESNLLNLVTKMQEPEVYDIGYGFGEQGRDDMLWIRDDWIFEPEPTPCRVVHGHTSFSWHDIEKIRLADLEFAFYGRPGRICHYYDNRYCIDCGISENGYLGCLRLDDLEEFYVKAD